MKKIVATSLFFLFSQLLISQTNPRNILDSLNALSATLYGFNPDSAKIKVNKQIEIIFDELLNSAASLDFPFDSVHFIKTLVPEDNTFRIITWAVPLKENTFFYAGILQTINKNVIKNVFRLSWDSMNPDPKKRYSSGHWPGGVFFRIIEKETSEGKVYTFFSWMGAKKGLGIRVIESMVFDSVGSPVFGTPVFILPSGKINCRVIFEFTDEIPFHLNYEKQDYPGKKRKKTDMIVFNHLSGNNPRMGKMFLAPVPDYSIFDALIFENDHWTFYGDIDVRIRDESQMQLKPSHRSVVEPDGK